MAKIYIGDGVYADLSRGTLTLTTDDGDPDADPSNVVYLEGFVMDSLIQYLRHETSNHQWPEPRKEGHAH